MKRQTGFVFVAAFAICMLQAHVTAAQSAASDSAEAVGPIEGDYNSNGLVEQGDLDLVLGNWGQDLTLAPVAQWTNDLPSGVVDQEELDGVLVNWGNTGSTIVPEPSSLWLLIATGAGAFALWRCRGDGRDVR